MRREFEEERRPGPRLSKSRIADGYRDAKGDMPVPRYLESRSSPLSLGLLLLVAGLAATSGILGALLITRGGDGADGTSTTPDAETASDPGEGNGSNSEPQSTPDAGNEGLGTSTDAPSSETIGQPADAFPTPQAPFVQATLTGPEFVVTGTVPSTDLLTQIEQISELVYSSLASSTLTVDEQLSNEPWLAATPAAVALLQTITDGTILVSEGRVSITGSAASADDLALLEQHLIDQTGLPVTSYGVTITNLKPVSVALNASENTLTIGGALPSEEIQQGFLAAAIDAYGADNVLDTSTVDPTVTPKLWMYNPVALITTISAYSNFRLGFDGRRIDSSFSGGPTFAPGSAELSPEFAQNLSFGIVALTSEPRMTVRIEGHTDSQGPEGTNLTLSQARADAVAALYIGAGIDPERITAVGLGESDPIADNGTEEGRSRNRRIDLDFVIEDQG